MEKPRRQAGGRVIRRGEWGVDGWSGPLWSPVVPADPFPDWVMGHGEVAEAGDHKGPPRSVPPPSPLRTLMGFSLT